MECEYKSVKMCNHLPFDWSETKSFDDKIPDRLSEDVGSIPTLIL
jgi:hypothetical protein